MQVPTWREDFISYFCLKLNWNQNDFIANVKLYRIYSYLRMQGWVTNSFVNVIERRKLGTEGNQDRHLKLSVSPDERFVICGAG